MSHLDKRKAKFLRQCPEVEKRFEPCLYTSFGDLCFYSDEWVCNKKCISKGDVCRNKKRKLTQDELNNYDYNKTMNNLEVDQEEDTVCDWGLKKCGKNHCVSRYTPCHGKCWNEANPSLCGSNLCLNEYQLRVRDNPRTILFIY